MSAASPETLARQRRIDLLALGVAVLGISSSGPLVVAYSGPVLPIAFWRTCLGALATAPFAWRHRHSLRALSRRELVLVLLAGVFLGAHFATWIPSLRYTSIAASIAIAATQVVWAGVFAYLAGHRAPAREWVGISIAVIGVTVLTGLDFGLSPRSLIGDALALAAALLAAAYMQVGQQVRTRVPVTAYTTLVYATSALSLLVFLTITGVNFTALPARNWWIIIGITAFAQLGGHSLMNQALRSFSASTVSLAVLLEVPGATLMGWFWPGQTPPLQILPAGLLIILGIALVLHAGRGAQDTPVPLGD